MVVPGVPAQLLCPLPGQISTVYHHGHHIFFYTVFTLFSYGKVFGALVAGMTSEGGGAVAFPVNFNLF